VITVFVPVGELEQSYEDLHLRGIRFDRNTGLRALATSVRIDRNAEWIEVIRISLAAGRVLNYQPPVFVREYDVDFREPQPSPEDLQGHDSLCVTATGEYVVFSPDQVQCCNFVRFRGGKNLATYDDDGRCDLCKAAEATIWCVNDGAKFCDECDRLSHTNEIQERHTRMTVKEGRALMEFCPHHTDLHVAYYCDLCKIPVCIECKMVGHHARGECAVHELRPIRSSYAEAYKSSEHPSPIVVRRRKEIAEKLLEVDLVRDDIWANTERVILDIQELANRAIEQAKLLAGQKLLIVRSVRTELLRKNSDLEAMMHSLMIHREKSGPLAFLQAFHRQNLMATGLQEQTKKENDQESSDLPLEITVRGDLRIHGNLRVDAAVPSPVRPLSRPPEREEEEEPPEQAPPLCPRSPTSPLKRAAHPFEFTSLLALAARRRQRIAAPPLTFEPFKESRIVTDSDERSMLYFCCPFKGQPFTRLLFSTEADRRSIATMHDRIDDVGITILFARRGPYKFGGFAAMKWKMNGEPFAQSSGSFLFSLTRDAQVPLRPGGALSATKDTLRFGESDLVFAEDFERCTSEIEHGFGIGLPEGSPEACSFLAGRRDFKPDLVEVWGFFTYDE
jgi:hypothetical protein